MNCTISLQSILCQTATPQKSWYRFCSTLLLAGVMSAGLVSEAFAASAPGAIANASASKPHSAITPKTSSFLADKPNRAQFPRPLANKLRQDINRRFGIPPGKIRILETTQRTWSDGCLGLGQPNEICAQALVQGWRVVLTNGARRWVYRTDSEGRVYRLETRTTFTNDLPDAGNIHPTRIPTAELPPTLQAGEVFRAIASGGIAARTYQTTLMQDGRLIQVRLYPNGAASMPQVRRISQEEVQRFQALLAQQHLEHFQRLNYPAVNGSADYITVTLSDRSSTVRYADTIRNQLPTPLQSVIQAWDLITRGS